MQGKIMTFKDIQPYNLVLKRPICDLLLTKRYLFQYADSSEVIKQSSLSIHLYYSRWILHSSMNKIALADISSKLKQRNHHTPLSSCQSVVIPVPINLLFKEITFQLQFVLIALNTKVHPCI